MADGRHFEKTVKTPYLCNRLTDFDEIWQGDANSPLTADRPLKFRIFEIQDGGGRNPENHKNRDISQRFGQIFPKFGTLMQNESLNRSDH